MADPHEARDCADPSCPEHGVAASNRRQSEFYASQNDGYRLDARD